jgi:hypothetical protein
MQSFTGPMNSHMLVGAQWSGAYTLSYVITALFKQLAHHDDITLHHDDITMMQVCDER